MVNRLKTLKIAKAQRASSTCTVVKATPPFCTAVYTYEIQGTPVCTHFYGHKVLLGSLTARSTPLAMSARVIPQLWATCLYFGNLPVTRLIWIVATGRWIGDPPGTLVTTSCDVIVVIQHRIAAILKSIGHASVLKCKFRVHNKSRKFTGKIDRSSGAGCSNPAKVSI